MKSIRLNSTLSIPVIGFGTWQLQGDECIRAVTTALEIGYRALDTADRYNNHLDVAKAVKSSGLSRDQLFITTKLWREKLDRVSVFDCVDRFLEELETDYLDLLLIHWPNRSVPLKETLEAMSKLKDKGIIKAIGVSNFTIHHLQDAINSGFEVSNNQIELRPSFNQKELREFCIENNISITSYSTIKQGVDFENEIVKNLAKKYSKSPSQIILNWAITQNIIVIPRSTNPGRIKENFEASDWQLEDVDIEKLNNINQKERFSNPTWADFEY